MPELETIVRWNRRPEDLVFTLICLGLGCLALVAGFYLYTKSNMRQPLWLVFGTIVGIWLGFHGGPLLLKLTEKTGLWGQVRVSEGHWLQGPGARIDLSKPFTAEARMQRSTVVLNQTLINLFSRNTGGGRDVRSETRVLALTLAIEQEGNRLQLTADETNHKHGREANLEGLNIRQVSIQAGGKGPRARMWPADLADLLRMVQKAQGYTAATTPVAAETPDDPRKILSPTWKKIAGAAVILLVTVATVFLVFGHYQTVKQREAAVMLKAAEREGQRLELEARTLIGRRVVVTVREKVRIYGVVSGVEMVQETHYSPDYRIEWQPRLKVKIDSIQSLQGNAPTEIETTTFRHGDDHVQVGGTIDISLHEAQIPEGYEK